MERNNSTAVNLFKKGDKADPGKYGGITLLSTVGKPFSNIFNNGGEGRKKKAKGKQGLGETVAA